MLLIGNNGKKEERVKKKGGSLPSNENFALRFQENQGH